ncbi:MAG TPA: ASCH domain-containing protein [Pirellulales bacterium]|jgi:hypothetical protein|nr:ASCH domain-containing protein [Pirellulales bacterium]
MGSGECREGKQPARFNDLLPLPPAAASPQPPAPGPLIALSIRQPYVEMILRGTKKIEYRSLPTRRRGRIYIYASRIPADDPEAWQAIAATPGDFPVGLLVGTVEITGCSGRRGNYHWHLAHPERLADPLPVSKKPQPMFFYPW